jgi:hypothetical protein
MNLERKTEAVSENQEGKIEKNLEDYKKSKKQELFGDFQGEEMFEDYEKLQNPSYNSDSMTRLSFTAATEYLDEGEGRDRAEFVQQKSLERISMQEKGLRENFAKILYGKDLKTLSEDEIKEFNSIYDELLGYHKKPREDQDSFAQKLIEKYEIKNVNLVQFRNVLLVVSAKKASYEFSKRVFSEKDVVEKILNSYDFLSTGDRSKIAQRIFTDKGDFQKLHAKEIDKIIKNTEKLKDEYEETTVASDYIAEQFAGTEADDVAEDMGGYPAKPEEAKKVLDKKDVKGVEVEVDSETGNSGTVEYQKVKYSFYVITTEKKPQICVIDPNSDKGYVVLDDLTQAPKFFYHREVDRVFSKSFLEASAGKEKDPTKIKDEDLISIVAQLSGSADVHDYQLSGRVKTIVENLGILLARSDDKYPTYRLKVRALEKIISQKDNYQYLENLLSGEEQGISDSSTTISSIEGPA